MESPSRAHIRTISSPRQTRRSAPRNCGSAGRLRPGPARGTPNRSARTCRKAIAGVSDILRQGEQLDTGGQLIGRAEIHHEISRQRRSQIRFVTGQKGAGGGDDRGARRPLVSQVAVGAERYLVCRYGGQPIAWPDGEVAVNVGGGIVAGGVVKPLVRFVDVGVGEVPRSSPAASAGRRRHRAWGRCPKGETCVRQTALDRDRQINRATSII
jgi:hypothetical protein